MFYHWIHDEIAFPEDGERYLRELRAAYESVRPPVYVPVGPHRKKETKK